MSEKVSAHWKRRTPPYTFLEFWFWHAHFQSVVNSRREEVNTHWCLAKKKNLFENLQNLRVQNHTDIAFKGDGETSSRHKNGRPVLILCLRFRFTMDVSRRPTSQNTWNSITLTRPDMPLFKRAPYEWNWMRESSQTEKEGHLLILSLCFAFGMTMPKMRFFVARELMGIDALRKI